MTDIKKVLQERGVTHGNFKDNARVSQALKALLEHELNISAVGMTSDKSEALDMIALKLSRIVTGSPNVKDHWLDIAGYATLVANTLED